MKKQKFNQLLALVSVMPLAAGSQAVYAQVASQPQPVEEIVVTGFRASILNSIEAKRQADVVSDIVDSDAAGSLPAISIADALGRIPGVTTVRSSGHTSELNIRGMNGDFIETTLNGNEQASTSSYTQSSRWMAFDQYPAELITQAAVYKSPKASLIEGGVAGTVEMKTANPLDAAKPQTFNLGYRRSFNDAAKDVGADEWGDRFSVSYLGKFMDNTLGVALGYARLEQPNNFEGSRAGADDQVGYVDADVNGDAQPEARARAYQFQAGNGKDTRDGYLATLVFSPSDSFSAQLDYFKSSYESQDFRHGVTIGGLGSGFGLSSLRNAAVANGVVVGGTYSIGDPKTQNKSSPWFEARTEDQSTEADSDSLDLNVEWSINAGSTLKLNLSHSKGTKTRRDRLATMHAYEFASATGDEGHYLATGIANDPATPADESQQWVVDRAAVTGASWQELSGQTMTFVGRGDKTPSISFNDNNLLTSSNMRLSRYEEYPHKYVDDIDSVRVDFKQDVTLKIITSFEIGARLSKREFNADRGAFLYGSRDGQFKYVDSNGRWVSYCADNLSTIACMPQPLAGHVGIGQVAGAPDHYVADMASLADSIFGRGNYQGKQVFSQDWTFVESGDLEEKVQAAYIMANLESTLAGVPVTGNLGVRVVHTDEKAIGLQNVGSGNGQAITDDVGVTQTNFDYVKYGPEFTDTLPSLNLNFAITEQDNIRFALAKVMGRPPAGQLKGGAGSWLTDVPRVDGNGQPIMDVNGNPVVDTYYNVWTKGSPFLKPFRASQVDISYEHYFADGGSATAAIFWKDIKSLTEKVTYPAGSIDFASLGIEIPAGYRNGEFQTVQNTRKGGYIRGLELATTQTFTQLPGIFAGLGVTASYSYTESETEIGGGSLFGQKLPIAGLSKNVWSITGFWDIDKFSTHLNVRYRDDYVMDLPIPGSTTPALAKEYTTLDYQASYAFENGVELIFEANNLTDEANIASYGEDAALGEYKTFGRTYYLGFNYKF